MLDIRPVSDLRNKFVDIEEAVKKNGHVILTKNGYGSMVVLSIEEYSRIINNVELSLDEADRQAETDTRRLTHAEVFDGLRK